MIYASTFLFLFIEIENFHVNLNPFHNFQRIVILITTFRKGLVDDRGKMWRAPANDGNLDNMFLAMQNVIKKCFFFCIFHSTKASFVSLIQFYFL